MRPRPHSSFAALLALSGAAGCNAIFGITPGSEGGTTSTTGGTGGITGGTGGTGGVTGGTGGVTGGTGGATGGTGGMAGGTGGATGGTGGYCSGSGGPPTTGKAYLQRTSAADGGEVGRAMRFDADGNLFLTGTFTTDQVNFGGGKLAYSNPMSYPYEEVFVLKSDPAGDHLASVSWSVTGSARSHGLAVDPANGEVIVVGEFTGDMQIGNTLLQSFELAYTDMFIARLAPDLTPIWAKKFGAIYRQEPEDIAIDSQGNIVVVGATFHPVDFGGGSIGNDSWNTFVVKLSPAGDFVWNQSYATWEPVVKENEDNYYNLAVAIAPNDDVLVGTNFNNQVFFGGSQTFPKGGMDAVVVRLAAADKTFVWKRVIDGGGDVSSDRDQWITSLAVDACGDVYVAGGFRGQLTNGAGAPTLVKGPDPTIADAFLMKLDDAGTVTWQKVFGDAGWQEPTAVRTDSFGNVALAGYMNDGAGYTGVDFGGSIGVLGPNIPDPSPNYSNDAFVVLLDPDGTGLWGRRLGDGEYQAIRSAAFDKKGQLAVTGVFSGAMVLDASQTTLFGVGYDAFVGWYDKAN